MEDTILESQKSWGLPCPECQGSGKNVVGASCLNCAGFGRIGNPDFSAVPMERTRTITETEKPVILREPNGRKTRDLFTNSSPEDQITWVKGRLCDVFDPSLGIARRQSARLNLGHCLQKDPDHKLPEILRRQAEKVASEPLPRIRRQRKI